MEDESRITIHSEKVVHVGSIQLNYIVEMTLPVLIDDKTILSFTKATKTLNDFVFGEGVFDNEK